MSKKNSNPTGGLNVEVHKHIVDHYSQVIRPVLEEIGDRLDNLEKNLQAKIENNLDKAKQEDNELYSRVKVFTHPSGGKITIRGTVVKEAELDAIVPYPDYKADQEKRDHVKDVLDRIETFYPVEKAAAYQTLERAIKEILDRHLRITNMIAEYSQK